MEYNPVNLALQGRGAGRIPHVHARSVRLLGDRVRLPRIAAGDRRPRSWRGSPHAVQRAAARVHGRRRRSYYSGLDPRRQHVRPGHRSARSTPKRQLKLARELWQLAETRPLKPGETYALLRRNFDARPVRGPAERALRGQVHRRPHAAFRPRGQRPRAARAGPGRQAARGARSCSPTTYLRRRQLPLPARSCAASRSPTSTSTTRDACGRMRADRRRRGRPAGARAAALGARPAVGRRRSRSACSTTSSRSRDPTQALRLAELYATLHAAILSELATGEDIPLVRRNLQREYAARGRHGADCGRSATMPADARALLRGRRPSSCATRPRSPRGDRDAADARASGREPPIAGRSAEGAAGAAGRLTGAHQGRPMAQGTQRRGGSRSVVLAPPDNRALANLCGPLDANLRQIEAALDVAITHRGGAFTVAGETRAGAARRGGAAALLRRRGKAAVRRRHPAGAGRDRDAAEGASAASKPPPMARRTCARAAPTCTDARRTRSST